MIYNDGVPQGMPFFYAKNIDCAAGKTVYLRQRQEDEMTCRRISKVAIPVLVTGTAVFALGCLMRIHMEFYRNSLPDYEGYTQMYLDSRGVLEIMACIVLISAAVCGMLAYAVRDWRRICRSEDRGRMANEQLREIKTSVGRLQDAYVGSEKNYRAKTRFMNRMSHDLRTPMNAIMGYSALMERVSRDPEKVNHYASRISVAGQTLLELINDTLDMSCIESGSLKLVEQEFSLTSAFDEVVTAVKPQTEARRQLLSVFITNAAGKDMVAGDKQRFCQVLRNLMSNAVKYTEDGGSVELTANITEINLNQLRLVYTVKDDGCGMSEDFVERVFFPFEREENEKNRGVPGTGLGMCIVKSFVELMAGTVSIESEQGRGTSVTVMLPLKAAVRNKKDSCTFFPDSNALRGLHFLAAEDNESNAEILKEVLAALGAECTLAGDGQKVVELLEQSVPGMYDAVLMDIHMPVMNGYQAAAKIRNSGHPDGAKIAIIAMTADAFEEDVQRAFVSGMNAHVAKPLNLHSFIGTIKALGLN